MTNQFKTIFCMTIFLLLTACGGGSSDPNSVASNELSRGVITGFGSVFVNGTRYHTDSATIRADDTILNDVTELKLGMVAKVISASSSAVASSVSFDEDVKGPADSPIANFDAAFLVMGQTVIVDSATIIDNSLVLPLSAGDILEVSGFRQADDSILATFIESKDLNEVNKFKVIGNAGSVDINASTFVIGSLTIDYSSANVGDLTGGHPQEGQLVEVKDENRAYSAGSGTLVATRVEPFDFLDGGDNENTPIAAVEVETVVTSVVTPGVQFKIPNYTVNIQPGTSFRFGTSADISVGTVLKIKATKNTNGELDATRITFKRNSARMDAPVDTGGVNPGSGQLTVLGITIQVNPDTEMEDNRNGVSPFTVADISDGDYLRVRGFTGVNGDFIATRLERDSNDNKVEIRGIVSKVDTVAKSMEILGIPVLAGPATVYDDGNSSADDFFAAITNGLSIVNSKWDPFVNTGFSPKELEMEDDFSSNKLSN